MFWEILYTFAHVGIKSGQAESHGVPNKLLALTVCDAKERKKCRVIVHMRVDGMFYCERGQSRGRVRAGGAAG